MRARRAIATVATVVSIGSLAGCGEDPSASGGTASGSVGSGPSASGSSPAASADGQRLDETSLVPAITASQRKARSAHVSISMSGTMSLSGEGDVSYRGGDPQMQMTMSMPQLGTGRMSLRLVDGIVYLSVPRLTPAGTFLKIDPDDRSTPLGRSLGPLSEQMDPMRSLTGMQEAVREVRYVGPATVDGVDTDHYVMTVDSAALVQGMKHRPPAGMPARIGCHLWLDDRDLPRRMRVELAGQRTVMTMSQWGEPVQVRAPAAAQLTEPPASLGGATTG